eukprot:Phypoly_transcript_04709.p1 GENE.Phypoly_transcript_04709~~Phypoly_transcript_04709.p1  ORF type:complete len:279 (+),score=77.72 Phypoly_transcript_04709:1066-1902(+)
MDISPMHIHEPDRANNTIVVEVGSKEDADYIIEQGVNMKPQKLNVLQEAQASPYVVYLATPAKSQESCKIIWENHFQFIPETFYFSADLCSAAFLVSADNVKKMELGAPTFRVFGSKPVIAPYTLYRATMTFSSPMDKEHLLSTLRGIVPDPSSLSIYPVFDSTEENSTTFFSAFIHLTDDKSLSALVDKDIHIPPFVPTPPSSAPPTPYHAPPPSPSRAPPPSPSKNTHGGAQNLCFSLPVIDGVSAPEVFTAFKAFGEKGKGKGAWNILFVFDREG